MTPYTVVSVRSRSSLTTAFTKPLPMSASMLMSWLTSVVKESLSSEKVYGTGRGSSPLFFSCLFLRHFFHDGTILACFLNSAKQHRMRITSVARSGSPNSLRRYRVSCRREKYTFSGFNGPYAVRWSAWASTTSLSLWSCVANVLQI